MPATMPLIALVSAVHCFFVSCLGTLHKVSQPSSLFLPRCFEGAVGTEGCYKFKGTGCEKVWCTPAIRCWGPDLSYM